MPIENTTRSRGRALRFVLMSSAALAVGLGAAAVFAHETQFGKHLLHRLVASAEPTKPNDPKSASLMDQARQALEQNHPDVAIIFLKQALAAAPDDSVARVQLGIALLRTGDSVGAERELRKARELGASDQTVLPVLLTTMLARSENEQLLTEFPPPADGDTSAVASLTLRARAAALNRGGRLKDAAASLDRALGFDPSLENIRARAQQARIMGDSALAAKLVDEALSKSPEDAAALTMKVDLLLEAKQEEKALVVANELVKHHPDSPDALTTRAGVFLRMQDHAKALADVEASLKAAPRMPLATYYKALALEQAKDVKQAWSLAQNLPPGFVNSRPEIASAVSQMATSAGHDEIGTSILAATVASFPKDVDARVRLATRYLDIKDPTRALQTLQPMESSSDPRVLVLFARAYDMQRQYSKSVEYLEKARAAGVGGDLLNRQIGISNLEAGNLDAAAQQLANLSGDAKVAAALIEAFVRKGEFAKAEEVAAKLTSAAPNAPEGPFFQGQILRQRGDLDGAISALSRSISLDQKFIPAFYARATAFAARGDLDSAESDMESILKVDPNNMMAQINVAQINLQKGQKDKAVDLLKQAIAAHPKEPLPALVLAGFYVQQKETDQATAVVTNFLKEVPGNIDAQAMRGQIQLAAGKPDQAADTFAALAITYPKSAQIQMLLASAYAKGGKTDEAIGAYQRALELAPAMQAAPLALIQLYIANKNESAALAAAQDYAKKQPGPVSSDMLARTYATLNKPGDAINVLTDSQTKYPNGQTLVELTTLLRKQGEAKKAEDMLKEWVAKHPEDLAVRMAYGLTQLRTDRAAAEAQYRAVLDAQPYNLAALNNMGWLLQQTDPKKALPYVERAAKMAPNSAPVLDTLAWTKWLLNDKSGALPLLERAHANDPGNAEIAYHLVLALDGNGRRAEAKKLLTDLLAGQHQFDEKKEAEALSAKWQ